MVYAKKMILTNAVSIYPGGSKELNGRFSQLNNFADTAVFQCMAEYYKHAASLSPLSLVFKY